MKKARRQKVIVVRVDSGNRIGMGHVTEVLSLLRSLKKRISIRPVFVTREYPAGVQRIRIEGFPVRTIPSENDVKKDSEYMRNAVDALKPDLLLIDLLRVPRIDAGAISIDEKYVRQFCDKGYPVAAIFDDTLFDPVGADLTVNFHICQEPPQYRNMRKMSLYLLGAKYALIDEQYSELAKKQKPIAKKCGTIFINQGGSDPYALTAKILRALQRVDIRQQCEVVVGSALKPEHRTEIETMKRSLGRNYRFYSNIPPRKMQQLMMKSDLAITAAGNTLYELCALGVPSIIVSHHKDHDAVARIFARRKAVVNLGIGTEISEESIAKAVMRLVNDARARRRLRFAARKVCDGRGTARVADRLIRLIEAGASRVES